MPHKSAGAGSPITFRCPVARREWLLDTGYGDAPREHDVVLTGRTKPYKTKAYSAIGSRSTFVSREVRVPDLWPRRLEQPRQPSEDG